MYLDWPVKTRMVTNAHHSIDIFFYTTTLIDNFNCLNGITFKFLLFKAILGWILSCVIICAQLELEVTQMVGGHLHFHVNHLTCELIKLKQVLHGLFFLFETLF
jgi:hypothetical protein